MAGKETRAAGAAPTNSCGSYDVAMQTDAPAHADGGRRAGRDVTPYDALLLVSFGGPEKPEDVVPFLENVTRGRGIARERLEEVGEHYAAFGGRSPINDQNRAFLNALGEDLGAAGIDVPVYWGNRNWAPYLADTLADMARDGVARAACFFTSVYSSYSGCRQYRENLAEASAAVRARGLEPPVLDRLRLPFNHPGFAEPNVDATLAALAELPQEARVGARIVFVTHSIPTKMDQTSGPQGQAYSRQHHAVAEHVVARVQEETGRRHDHDVVFCSRSGPPQVPWLEPDVNDHLTDLHGKGVPGVVLVPIGFVSDHLEVVYDLDTEALGTARGLGLPVVRAATAGIDPRFVAGVRDLLLERVAVETGRDVARATVGSLAAVHDRCPAQCCPNLRGHRPTLCGADA
jgi:ferrochelatase